MFIKISQSAWKKYFQLLCIKFPKLGVVNVSGDVVFELLLNWIHKLELSWESMDSVSKKFDLHER